MHIVIYVRECVYVRLTAAGAAATADIVGGIYACGSARVPLCACVCVCEHKPYDFWTFSISSFTYITSN